MKLHQIIQIIEEWIPLPYAEDFDNVGLLIGDSQTQISGILVCHDALQDVIDEAISLQYNLVVCFHPIIFSGIKKITGTTYVERTIQKAIQHNIAIYALHTAFDNHPEGVNKSICQTLGLMNPKILIPKPKFIQKLVTYVPETDAESLKQSLFKAGAGNIGNYTHCSFSTKGMGTYQGNDQSNPTIGTQNIYTQTEEVKIEVVFDTYLQNRIVQTLIQNHPYEQVAYEIYNLENKHTQIGLGMIGTLAEPISEVDFLQTVKHKMQCGGIRHSAFLQKKVQTVAVLGGSGAFAIPKAIQAKADVLLTADLKYHDYYQAENKILLADIGHYESERFTKNYIYDFLCKKIPNFAVALSNINTNPINYL